MTIDHDFLEPGCTTNVVQQSPRRAAKASSLLNRFNTSIWQRTAVGCVLGLLLFGLSWTLATYHIPANGGVDQNGYLVMSRLLAERGTFHFVPENLYQYIGMMMIQTEDGRIFAKYPPGFPMLAAMARVVAGPQAAYWVNPICTVLACAIAYLFFRQILDQFCSLLATIVLATNPVVLALANSPTSHASTLLCVCVGFWGLFHWLQKKSWVPALLGAGALGYAATIRYTEILLILPLLFLLIVTFSASRKRLVESFGILLCWAIPVILLASYCWISFGAPWKTGYSYCAEDTGFGLKYFLGDPSENRQGHWETLVSQMNWLGLFGFWPVGIIGLITMVGVRWKSAALLMIWAIPPSILYLGYYWGPQGDNTVGYLRFYVSILPCLIVAAFWLLQRSNDGLTRTRAIALGTVVALVVSVNVRNIVPSLERGFAADMAVAQITSFVQEKVPQGSMILISDENISNNIDSYGGYLLCNLSLFSNSSYEKWQHFAGDADTENEPAGRQRTRMKEYLDLVSRPNADGHRTPQAADKLRNDLSALIMDNFQVHRRVFVILKKGQTDVLPYTSHFWRSQLVGTLVVYPQALSEPRPAAIASGPRNNAKGMLRSEPGVTWKLFEVSPISKEKQ